MVKIWAGLNKKNEIVLLGIRPAWERFQGGPSFTVRSAQGFFEWMEDGRYCELLVPLENVRQQLGRDISDVSHKRIRSFNQF